MASVQSMPQHPTPRRKSLSQAVLAPLLAQLGVATTAVPGTKQSGAEPYASSESSCPSDDEDGESNAQSLTSGTSDSESDAETDCADGSERQPTIRLVGTASVHDGDIDNDGLFEDVLLGEQPSKTPLSALFRDQISATPRRRSGGVPSLQQNAGLAINFQDAAAGGQVVRRERKGTVTATRGNLPNIDTSVPRSNAYIPRIEVEQVYDGDDDEEEQKREAATAQVPNSPGTARRAARLHLMQRLGRTVNLDSPRKASWQRKSDALSPSTPSQTLPTTPGTTFHATYPIVATPTSARHLDTAGGVQLILTPPTPREQRSPILGVVLQGSPRAALRNEMACFEGSQYSARWLEAPIFELAPGRRQIEQAQAKYRRQQDEQMQALAWLAWQKQMQDENLREMQAAGHMGVSVKPYQYNRESSPAGKDAQVHEQLSNYEERRQQRQQERGRSLSQSTYVAQVQSLTPRSASSWWRGSSCSSAPATSTTGSSASVYSADSGKYTGGVSQARSAQTSARDLTTSPPSSKLTRTSSSAADLASWWRKRNADEEEAAAAAIYGVPLIPMSAPASTNGNAFSSVYVAPPRRVHFREQAGVVAALRRGNPAQTGYKPGMTLPSSSSDSSIKGRKEGDVGARVPSSVAPANNHRLATADPIRLRAAQSMMAKLGGCARMTSTQSVP